jgi:integrase
MATLVKRQRTGGGNSYRVRWRYGGAREGAWQSVTFTERETAKTFKALVESRAHRLRADAPEVRDLSILTGGRPLRSGAPTFQEVAQRYIDTRPTVKANTREKYKGLLDNSLSAWASRAVDEITRDDVADLVNRIHAEGRSPVAAFDFARSVFRYATSTEPPLRAGNPCALVRVPRSRTRTQNFLTHAEADLLLDSAEGIARPMIEALLNTGLRTGELCGLRVADLHLGDRPTLTVRESIRRAQGGQPSGPGDPKSAAGRRTIALDDHTASVLAAQVKGKKPTDHVFVHPATGEFFRADAWRKRCWEPTLARAIAAGLSKQPRPHDLRHTHAAWLLTDGVPLLVVSRRLGHESVAVTANIYGHIQPEADDAVRAVLARRAPKASRKPAQKRARAS